MQQLFTDLNDENLVQMMRHGGVGILPTDTVYGLVACASDEAAIARMYQLKPRELSPGTIIAASVEDLAKFGFDSENLRRASRWWPAPLSVVLEATNVPAYLRQRRESLAVRIPDDETLRQLLSQTGPLMTTSANAPGEPTATTIASARNYFGSTVDFYVDKGDIGERPPSTIVGFDGEALVVYREGAVSVEKISV